MTEDNKRSSKRSKTIHVDTLHIRANEVIIHQEHHEDRNSRPQNRPHHIERDFWGFPIPQVQGTEEPENREDHDN